MAVRSGVIADTQPFAAARCPAWRAARPAMEGLLFDLFGNAEGQPISINVDAVVRVLRPIDSIFDAACLITRQFALLADLQMKSGGRRSLLADTGARIRGDLVLYSEVRVRIGPRVTRLADLSQCIGVGAKVSADAALTVYRVVLHEDHLILT